MNVLMRLLLRRMVKYPPAPFRVVVLLLAILLYGTTGFLYFELSKDPALTWPDALWYSIVTIATVGYGDYAPKTVGGRFIVAMPMMFFGIGLLGYALSLAASALVQEKAKELHGMGSHKKRNHLILINFPSLGKVERVIDELMGDPLFRENHEVILIDEDLTELPPELVQRGVDFVRGNPTRDETLTRASIDTAAHAIVLSKKPGDPHSDDKNVAITLAIERRHGKVHTVVECVDDSAQELLRKAGCDGIVCTSRFDAHFLSHELLNPGVQQVIEHLTTNLRGQQVYITRFAGSEASYGDLVDYCRTQGHLAIGLGQGDKIELNVDLKRAVRTDDRVVTIGAQRLPTIERT